MENCSKKHFVFVHGACHGAWCWYKVKPLLKAAGHRVTAVDMAASGIELKKIHDLQTMRDYSEPLIQFMRSVPDDEKVILVGHSLGGFNIAVAMEMFPHKIEVAVFLAAFMPDSRHTPSFIFEKFMARIQGQEDFWLDTEFKEGDGDPKETPTTMLFGLKFLSKLYHLSPLEDLELGISLIRPSSLFLHDLCKPETKLSDEKYGSVRRVYVVCEEDQAISQAFQQWMIENGGVKEVKELKGSDHMPMFCMPKQLSDCLLEIVT
ncbi:salicylic acid-binding protein 2-like isoform X1 [Amaranthus tricolor]|uniref:salicylic acid-binding protein 2-like isoform X1 n=1 Tax=Amaranthus tricolor TaxID=29722 RepID=UPI0025860CC7|nr:salicylic acid-binding protein 2-like isoform X1 [Amaranthus tricolor]